MKEDSKTLSASLLILKWSWCGPFLTLVALKIGAPYYEALQHLRRRVKTGRLVAASTNSLPLIYRRESVGPKMNEGRKQRLTLKSDLPEESVTMSLLRVMVVECMALY
jgi:hypothetical protein